jgi:hypothetical protein
VGNVNSYEMRWVFLFCFLISFPYFCFQIILYSGDKIYDNYYPDLKGRVHFTSNDVKSGDASINVTNLQLSDIGTYQCKVKKAPGVANKKFLLTVLGKSSFLLSTGVEWGGGAELQGGREGG